MFMLTLHALYMQVTSALPPLPCFFLFFSCVIVGGRISCVIVGGRMRKDRTPGKGARVKRARQATRGCQAWDQRISSHMGAAHGCAFETKHCVISSIKSQGTTAMTHRTQSAQPHKPLLNPGRNHCFHSSPHCSLPPIQGLDRVHVIDFG